MFAKKDFDEKGITDQDKRLRNNVKIGAKIKQNVFAFVGITVSFKISFKASAIGCIRPRKPTKFGPFRCCIEPITFRSARVIKATAISIGKIVIKKPVIFSRTKNKKNIL
jgi:hypothetical protein